MDLVYDIKNTKSDKEIILLINEIIDLLTKNSNILNNNETVIGPKININSELHFINIDDDRIVQEYRGYYWGFIPKGTKLIYGTMTNTNTLSQFSAGWYYYMDDFSYIYEFAKYIKDKEVNNYFNLVDYVYKFLRDYFDNYLDTKERDEIHKLILKDHTSYYDPINEHSNKDFRGNGAALCSEFSSAACNIFNVFGIEALYIQDIEHAYNIITIPDEDDEEVMDYYLFDSTIRVFSYEIDSEDYDGEAYVEYIPDFTEYDLVEFLKGEKMISLPEYYMIHDDNTYLRFYIDKNRDYNIQTDYYIDLNNPFVR